MLLGKIYKKKKNPKITYFFFSQYFITLSEISSKKFWITILYTQN